jgi:hypothetical protein
MDWKDIAGVVGKAAPILGTLLGGPAGGAVGGIIASALGTGNTADDVLAAIQGNPEAAVRLRELQDAKEIRFSELAAEQARLEIVTAAQDRASAREREAKTGDTWTPRGLAILVTLGFFGVLAFLLLKGKPEQGGDALLVMLGSLGTAWASITAYYFGSSAGSAQKTELMARRA